MQLKLLSVVNLLALLFFPSAVIQAQKDDSGGLPEDSASLAGVRKVSFTTMAGTKVPLQYWLDVGCVVVHDQGENFDCAYCACAHALSILKKIMTRRCRSVHEAETCEFSYTFLRNLHNRGEPCCTANQSSCRARVSDVLRMMMDYGAPHAGKFSNTHPCTKPVGPRDSTGAWLHRIDTFSLVAGPKPVLADTAQLQAAIARSNPVIANIQFTESFKTVAKGQAVWQIQPGETLGGCHVVVLTGYKPGYFQVLNSYGLGWGAKGFVLIPVDDFMRMLQVAFIIDWTCP